MNPPLLLAAPSRPVALAAERVKSRFSLGYTVFYRSGMSAPVILEQARKLRVEGIISRGGLTQALRAAQADLPVADIPVTALDIIESLQRALRITGNVACIGFKNVIYNVPRALSFLHLSDVPVFTRRHLDDGEDLVRQALRAGIEAIVGDARICAICHRLRVPAFHLRSGADAILAAYAEGENLIRARRTERRRFNQLETVLANIYSGVIVLDDADMISRLNPRACAMLQTQPETAVGKPLREAAPALEALLRLESDKAQYGLLLQQEGGYLSVSRIPQISPTDRVEGNVITLQPVSRAKDKPAEQSPASRKGHTARFAFSDILGPSPAITECRNTALKYAAADSSVLISGETGTGKELFAQSIHNAGTRAAAPFVPINCAALPEALLESELFGYVKGAFTDARREGRVGLFEQANDGTLFLDEITEIPLKLQARLLRAIQENEIARIGDDRIIKINVRVIAASNKRLPEEVAAGRFRNDLFYRLNILSLHVPPLRERGRDVVPLALHFLKTHAARLHKPVWDFGPGVEDLLLAHSWPGNVRELSGLMERLVVLSGSNTISRDDLAAAIDALGGLDVPEAIRPDTQGLREALLQCWRRHKGNRALMARELGIHRTTLWRQLKTLCPELSAR